MKISGLLITLALCSTLAAAESKCLSIQEAADKVGETACVKGTVLKVGEGKNGNVYLDFCADYRECPFTVFIPAKSLRDVGDVRELEGKEIEIHGKIEMYNGRAEIILKDVKQLKGDAAQVPSVRKEFDASRKGRFSAGQFSSAKSKRSPHGQPPPMEIPSGDVESH